MKKYIKDMNYEESKHLIHENYSLYTSLRDLAYDTATYHIEDYLTDFPGHYSIGYNRGDYITICTNDNDYYGVYCYTEFESWFNEVQKAYCLLSTDHENTIRLFLHYAEIAQKLMYEVQAKPKDEDYIFNKTNELKKESEQILLELFQGEYEVCDDEDVLVEHLDIWADNYDNPYIKDNDYSKVYEHINGYYVKAHEEEIA